MYSINHNNIVSDIPLPYTSAMLKAGKKIKNNVYTYHKRIHPT